MQCSAPWRLSGRLVAVQSCEHDAEGQSLPPTQALSEKQLHVFDTRGNAFVHEIVPGVAAAESAAAATNRAGTNELGQKLKLLSSAEIQASHVISADEIHACAAEIPW